MRKIITLEEGLNTLEEGIAKATMILDGYPTNALFTAEEYMKFYDCVYYMCIQHPPFDYSAKLYERFKKALEESILSRVLPALMNKVDAFLLNELWHMWTKYKMMTKCLGGFFLYLDRHFTDCRNSASLSDLSVCCFRDLVCNGFYQKFLDAAMSLISQDRDEKSIDRDLLKNVSTFFVEIGGQGNTRYYDSFENAILANTESYYNHLASQWLFCDSSANYFLKAEWCLNQEKGRFSQYLRQTSVEKLLQVVHWQLLGQTASKLTEKQKAESGHGSISYQELLSGCACLSLEDRSQS